MISYTNPTVDAIGQRAMLAGWLKELGERAQQERKFRRAGKVWKFRYRFLCALRDRHGWDV